MARTTTLMKKAEAPTLNHQGRRAGVDTATLDDLPVDLVERRPDGTLVLDHDALRQRVTAALDGTVDGLVLAVSRLPGSSVYHAGLAFRTLWPEGASGFILPELQEAFVTWQFRQRALWNELDDAGRRAWIQEVVGGADTMLDDQIAAVFHSPQSFVRRPIQHRDGRVMPSNTRGAILVDALMGPTAMRTFGHVPPTRYALKRWTATDTRRVVRETGPAAATDCALALNSTAGLRGHLAQAFADLGEAQADEVLDALTGRMEAYLTNHARRARRKAWHEANPGASMPAATHQEIEALTLADLDAAGVTSIYSRALHPTELAHRMIEADDLTRGWITAITGDPASFDQLRQLEGFDALYDAIIRRDGWQTGHIFELEVMVDLVEEGVNGLRLQVYLAGKKGPDFVYQVQGGALRIRQLKSYGSLSSLVCSSRSFHGGFLKQFRGDIRRMFEEDPAQWLPGSPPKLRTADGSGWQAVDPTYEFVYNENRIGHWRDPAVYGDALDEPLGAARIRAEEFQTEINGFLAAAPGDAARNTAVRAKLKRIVKRVDGVAKTEEMLIGEQLEHVAAGLTDVGGTTLATASPRLIFAMKLAMDDGTGVVNAALARRIFQMNPPFQLSVTGRSSDSFIPWDGKVIDTAARRTDAEDALGATGEAWSDDEVTAVMAAEHPQ
ncbi:hypothetical protein [Pseudoroseicyclus sp. CXY001]|uniref:hypothetical protein n=1 Tax=Pseudoroseicyclus sp. CXY001 TaxID=3242492 RepID=UPI00358DA3A3